MNNVLDLVQNPIIWGVIALTAGFFLKARLNTYLKLIMLLVEAIEVYDDDIKDIISDDDRKKLSSIKSLIARKVGWTKERSVLDKILDKQGYLN